MSNMTQQPATAVELFLLDPEMLRSGYGVSWLAYVGFEEQRRAAEFTHPDDAMTYAAQHALMRTIAATTLGVLPTGAAAIPVDRSCSLCDSGAQHGKPTIEGVNLNMSRTQGLVIGGFTRDHQLLLGIDVEKSRGSLHNGFDRIALAPSEREFLATLDSQSAQLVRMLLWNAKEAVLKATGHGLSVDPRSVVVTMSDDSAPFSRAHASFADPSTNCKYSFDVHWYTKGEHYICVAASAPVSVAMHRVTTPKMVRDLLAP
ncbi:4'-phosphopantetheinyl transferase family protein [Rothia terrae]|uniref:4'-phosphopantetheinyl transferase superfamily protein n=1 Tax=Rothia terrae TaxID=396015 RepID=A0A7H2BEK9_9MICC|nr:4'-phosphopantetheinyl transferase superfamily protein [Rothia terrae]QNV38105.1 4'-phosphopantetheinyl transferase superfamily protein [Rothia terrae]